MLIFRSPCRTAVFFARIVMPFSRSRSVESRTRSATSWLARNAPDCQSIASTSVVLPWSTWATIATLRMSSRVGTHPCSQDVSPARGRAGHQCLQLQGRGHQLPALPDIVDMEHRKDVLCVVGLFNNNRRDSPKIKLQRAPPAPLSVENDEGLTRCLAP